MGAAVAFTALPGAGAGAARRQSTDPVGQALAAAGGRPLLARVRVLSWTGTMRFAAAGNAQDFQVEMRIEPFVRGRSLSWIADEGRSTARTLMIEDDHGYVVTAGAQRPLSDAAARFERAQFGAFAYLLLAQASLIADGPTRLLAARPGFAPMRLMLGAGGRLVGADYAVDPATPGAIRHYRFDGTVAAQGVRFPRVTHILEAGRPGVTMTIADFAVELAPA